MRDPQRLPWAPDLPTGFRRTAFLPLFAATLVVLAGCDGETGSDGTPMTEAEELTAQGGAEFPPPRIVALQSMNESGVMGELWGYFETDLITLILELKDLPGEGSFATHIHEGRCADGGPILVPLNPVAGLPDGSGSSTTALDPPDLPSESPLFVLVHGVDGLPLACGDLEGPFQG
jgi:hypothetical protein